MPLLFPKYELGFGYKSPSDSSEFKCANDSFAGEARVQVGHLLPHVALTSVSDASRHSNLQWISQNIITTSDLPSQLRGQDPCFVLLVIAWNGDELHLRHVEELVHQSFGLTTMIVHVVKDPGGSGSGNLTFWDSKGDLHRLATGLVLIRPDGHVCYVGQDSHSLNFGS